MKRILYILIIAMMILQLGAAGAAEYNPIFFDDYNIGMYAIKSDFSLWKVKLSGYEYGGKTKVYISHEDDNILQYEPSRMFKVKTDNTLWYRGKQIMENVRSIYVYQVTGSEVGYYVIKTDGSLWAFGSLNKAVPGAKVWYEHGESYEVPIEKATRIGNNVISVGGLGGQNRNIFFVEKDYSLWVLGKGYIPGKEDEVEYSKPTKIMEGVRYIDRCFIIKSDDSLWSWAWGCYTGEERFNFNDFMPVPVKIMDDVRSVDYGSGLRKGIAVKNDNTVWAWGQNFLGSFSDDDDGKWNWPIHPTENDIYKPVMVGTDILDFFPGGYFLKTDGSLWRYGHDYWNSSYEPLKLIQMMSLIINGQNIIPTNEETVLEATYFDKDGNSFKDAGITWYCDDWSIAQLIPWGNHATIKGLKPGETVITAVHNATKEIASFKIRVEDYKFSLGDSYDFQKSEEKYLQYNVTFQGKEIPHDVTWRVENTEGTPLSNLTYGKTYIKFRCENEGQCLLIATINGNDVKKIPITVHGDLYELIEKQKVMEATVLSKNERFNYYKSSYVSAPHHITSRISNFTMKLNNVINNLFESDMMMTAYYEYVLWDLINSFEYNQVAEGQNEKIVANVTDFFVRKTVDVKMELVEEDLEKLNKHSPIDFGAVIDLIDYAYSTYDDLSSIATNMTNLIFVTTEKMKTIELIMNNTDDSKLKKACERILDKYQKAVNEDVNAINKALVNGSAKSTVNFLGGKVKDFIIDGLTLGAGGTVLDVTNLVLNTDDISERAVVLIAYTEIEKAMKKGLNVSQKEFEKNPCYDTSVAFTNLADSYKALLMVGCSLTSEYISAVETGDRSYSQIIFADMTPDGSLTPFGNDNAYDEYRKTVNQAKKVIERTDFYSTDGVDIAAYISQVRSTEPSDWAVEEINEAKKKGILPEYMSFNYTEDITRAEFCTLLTNMLTEKTGKNIGELIEQKGVLVKSPFEDTFYEYVDYMYKLGIVNGTGEGVFSPLEKITRQEAATMLTRAAKVLGSNTDSTAAVEAGVADWAKAGVGFVTENGIMKGTGSGFEPNGNYTKEQAIITFVRMFNSL